MALRETDRASSLRDERTRVRVHQESDPRGTREPLSRGEGPIQRKSRIRGEGERADGLRGRAKVRVMSVAGVPVGVQSAGFSRALAKSLEVVINAGLGHGQRNVFSRCCRGWLVRKKASGRAFALTINNRVRGYVQV